MTFQEALTKIQNAVYAIEVREAIYTGLLYLKNNSSGGESSGSVADASSVIFNNSGTGLSSTNVQEAILELKDYIDDQILGGAS